MENVYIMITNHSEDTRDHGGSGAELVVEFLDSIRQDLPSVSAEKVWSTLVEKIKKDFGCEPSKLCITDEQANMLMSELFAIANTRELEIARLPLNSR